MKVTQVALRPTEASIQAGRPSLTPELLASVGARYSRNNEGLEVILSKIDFGNESEVMKKITEWLASYIPYLGPDAEIDDSEKISEEILEYAGLLKTLRKAQLEKGVDAIFNMLDYGHQSIADMTPVAMFMDGISIFAAYYIWSITAVAGGQESSTRYIKMSIDGLLDPDVLGIPKDKQETWKLEMNAAFEGYQKNTVFWEQLSTERPDLMRIPQSLLDSKDDKDQKKVDRMRRNYTFDRARVMIPLAAATNVMMIQSARAWSTMISTLLSHPAKELNELGELLKKELVLAAPRLGKHTKYMESTAKVLRDEFESLEYVLEAAQSWNFEGESSTSRDPFPMIEISKPSFLANSSIQQSLSHRENRYSLCGSGVSRTTVRFGWPSVSIAEIRDFNRHRTGTKFCPLMPVGFYAAEEQVPFDMRQAKANLAVYAKQGEHCNDLAIEQYRAKEPSYIYWCLLGAQFPFEHVTTADKFVYEAELRTGLGAHYRYAKHLHDALAKLYEIAPEFKSLIKEGTAEPE